MTRPSIRPAAVGGLALAGVAAAVIAVSCTSGDGKRKETPPRASGAAAASQAAGRPVATVRGDIPELLLQVRELRHDPAGTVTARFILANAGTEQAVVGGYFGDLNATSPRQDVSGAYVFDGAKRYGVVKDANTCVCSTLPLSLEPGEHTDELFATFPSPGADVDRVSLVIPHFQPLDGIELPR
jgi:hypothetical protein